jgi:hypothetical protein
MLGEKADLFSATPISSAMKTVALWTSSHETNPTAESTAT